MKRLKICIRELLLRNYLVKKKFKSSKEFLKHAFKTRNNGLLELKDIYFAVAIGCS